MTTTLFVTGTDTECGKTTVTAALARGLVQSGAQVACFKPVAAGCTTTVHGLRNDDARMLQQASSVRLDYAEVNPYALRPAIAPHIAATQAGITFDLAQLARSIADVDADWKLVEGVGGWLVPLDRQHMMSDLARTLTRDIVLVVGLRLGCINHALLTARAIVADGFRLRGWIANRIDPQMAEPAANLATLEQRIAAPLWGTLRYLDDPSQAVIEPGVMADIHAG